MSHSILPPEGDDRAQYSAEIVEIICQSIRLDGVSDTSAGLLAGVSARTIHRWKKNQPGLAEALQRARADYRRARLECIRLACSRDGALDWRAQAWLAEHAGSGDGASEEEAPEEKVYGADPRVSPLLVVTPDDLVLLQQRRAAALEKIKPKP